MRLDRRVQIQLALFTVIAVTAGATMGFVYMRLPEMLFGVGQYKVTVDLPRAAGLYPNANVTYRGTEVGRVERVDVTDAGARVVMTLDSEIAIPSDLTAEVHSQSAIGEQFIALLPRSGESPPLKNGDVITATDTSVPPDIDMLLNGIDTGLSAIPQGNLKTAIDESYVAFGGLGPELTRMVQGSTQLAIDADANLDSLTALIDKSQPVLDSQSDSASAIQTWAARSSAIADQLRSRDPSLSGLIRQGGPAFDEGRQLFERLQPALPVLLTNLVSVGEVAVTYQPAIEQLLVLMPQGTSALQGILVANADTKQDYKGLFLNFQLNLNLPPACLTGYLPPQQQRAASHQDYPDRPAGDLYCRVPQDSSLNVRGARNYPCLAVPGKRAPTVAMCESDEQYMPLNDGFNWKGDPNATLSGQSVPQLPPGSEPPPIAAPGPAPPEVAIAEYDPATGNYIGPDGKLYTQSDLAQRAPKEPTWQSMLIPPTVN